MSILAFFSNTVFIFLFPELFDLAWIQECFSDHGPLSVNTHTDSLSPTAPSRSTGDGFASVYLDDLLSNPRTFIVLDLLLILVDGHKRDILFL